MSDNVFEMLPQEDVGVGKVNSAFGVKLTDVTWPAGTKLTLCNVAWDSDYCNCVYWGSPEARDSYFNDIDAGACVVLDHATYAFPGAPVRIDVPYHAAYTYNYLVVENPAQPVEGEPGIIPTFYYFITAVDYVAPNTTELTLQLDVWTTYQLDVRLGRAFVERGHVAMHAYANSDLEVAARKRRYLLAPEGIDVGQSYQTIHENIYSMGGGVDGLATEWTIVICSAVALEGGNPETLFMKNGKPNLVMASGMIVDGTPSGCEVWGLEVSNFKKFVSVISKYPWVAQNILSITAIPEGAAIHRRRTVIAGISAYEIESQQKDLSVGKKTTASVDRFLKESVSDKWAAQPKARVYPYSFLVADNLCSTPLTLKAEECYTDRLEWAYAITLCPAFQRIFVFPKYYGLSEASTEKERTYEKYRIGDTSPTTQTVPYGDTFNNSLIWSDFPQFSILNDSYQNYLASNAGALQYARDNAGWQLSRSKANANTTYSNAMRSISAATESQDLLRAYQRKQATGTLTGAYANALDTAFTKTAGLSKAAASQVGGALSKVGLPDVASSLSSGLSDMAGMVHTTTQYATGMAASNLGQQQFNISKGAERANVSANKKLAFWAAQGDYAMSIASVNAACQDAQILPPTQSGVASGGMYAVLGSLALSNWILQGKTVTREYQELIADYWQRFGYAVNDFMVIGDAVSLMTRFTYWKCQDLVVTGESVGEEARMAIKGIFEKGVTMFGNPDDIIGDMTVFDENAPLETDPLY